MYKSKGLTKHLIDCTVDIAVVAMLATLAVVAPLATLAVVATLAKLAFRIAKWVWIG